VSGGISYFIAINSAKDYGVEKDKIGDFFLTTLILGFIGARIFYALIHIGIFKENIFYLIKVTHLNLNLAGGIVFGLISLFILSKKYKVSFESLFNIFIVPFYFSGAIVIWSLFFDGKLIGKAHDSLISMNYMGINRQPVVIYLSLLFLSGALIESLNLWNNKTKYNSYIILAAITLLYYLLKLLLLI